MLRNKVIPFVLSRFNLDKISNLVKHTFFLKLPYKFFVQRLISYDFPQHIFLEPTNACNLKCEICARTGQEIKIGFMDFNLFKKIIDEAGQCGPRTFSLHLFGESFLAPRFCQMLQYVKRVNKNNTLLITTNGTLLTQKIGQALIENEIDKLFISFMSANKENYQRLAGVDSLEKVEKNVLGFIDLKNKLKKNRPLVYLRMVIDKNNQGEEELFKSKWKNQPVIADVRPAHNFGGNMPDVSQRKEAVKKMKRYPCYHLWLSPAVHWNGDVSICCDDWGKKALIGNAHHQTIHQIWNSQKIKEYRKYHLKGEYDEIPLCSGCDVWTMYEDIFFNWQKR